MALSIFSGKAGWTSVVAQDENSMQLDGHFPRPWWPNFQYKPGDIVVNGGRAYRCRKAINHQIVEPRFDNPIDRFNWLISEFNGIDNRNAWLDIMRPDDGIEDLPDAVGVAGSVVTADLLPNRRIYVDTSKGPVRLNIPSIDYWGDNDRLEIIDDMRTFDVHPCIIVRNAMQINYGNADPAKPSPDEVALNVKGVQDYWRFICYVNPANSNDVWLYLLSAPEKATGGAAEKIKPEFVGTPNTKETPFIFLPNTTYIVDTTNGPIYFKAKESDFEDGDTVTFMDFKRKFGLADADDNSTNAAILLPTDNTKYQNAVGDDGVFYMNVTGPSSGWPFLFFGGTFMCMNSPLDNSWIKSITDTLNALGGNTDEDQKPKEEKAESMSLDASFMAPPPQIQQSVTVISPPQFVTLKAISDVLRADPWIQYDIDMGRKKTLTVNLPPVRDVPARTKIRVRLVSAGRGVINVLPDSGDQILGMFGNLNSTPKGVPRTVHGQYAMIELESDGDHEWMVV